MVFPVVQVNEVQMPQPPVCIPIPCPLRGCPMSCPPSSPSSLFLMAWDSPWLQGQDTTLWQLLYLLPSPYSSQPFLMQYIASFFIILIAITPFLCLFFLIFFYFWDLSFQFNLLISVLISLCRLFADFTRHNFYQLVLKDA